MRKLMTVTSAGLLATVLTVATLPTAVAQEAVVVDHGHVDVVALRVLDGQLRMQYKDGCQPDVPVWREPATVVTHVKPEARAQVPDDPAYAFLGAPGADFWFIPETEAEGIVWAGWNTESLDASQVDPNSVRWTLDTVTGDGRGSTPPGAMTIFQTGSFGEALPRVFDTNQPLPQSYDLALGTHGHAYWTFNAEGVYRLTFTVTATSTGGQPLSDTETYTFAIGDVDPTTIEPGEGTEPTTTTTTTTTGGETTTTTSDPAGDCVVLDDGHVDAIAPRILDGRLTTQVKDGTAGPDQVVWREPDAVVLHLVPASRNTIPNNAAYAFLGQAGNPVWLIPQTQIPGIVWAGWNTEALSANTVSGDVTARLTEVDGPGNVAVFLTGLTPMVVFNAADGLPDTLRVPLGTHAHANWGFTAEGVYRLTVAVTATLASGETDTDTDTYTFAVGDVDPATALGGHCTGGGGGPTGTTTTAPGPTPNNPGDGPDPQGGTTPLAYTGTGGLATMVSLGVLLLAGGAALLVLYRRRGKQPA
jgi:surface-anchored protein